MKFFTSITLSVLLLVQAINLRATDILCVDQLIEHAQVHSENYGDSFLVFLSKHYGSLKEKHSKSHEGHENLPFKHDQTQNPVNFVLESFEAAQMKPPLVSSRTVIFLPTSTYTSLAAQNIFKPPKLA